MESAATVSSVSGYQRASLVRPFQILTAVTVVLVMIQAVLAGRGWYIDYDLIAIHGYVSNLTFLAVIAQVGLIVAIGIPGSMGKKLLILAAALAVLTTAQIGLGYGGRDSAVSASWHIPSGVLIFGLSVAVASFGSQLRSGDGR